MDLDDISSTVTSGDLERLLEIENWENNIEFARSADIYYGPPPPPPPLPENVPEDIFDREENHEEADPEEEDEFGYTTRKVQQKYRHLNCPIFLVTLTKTWKYGIGVSLCGHANLNKKATFINDVIAGGPANLNGQLQCGDQILEVNGHVFENVDFPTTAWNMKIMDTDVYKIIAARNKNISDCAFIEKDYAPIKLDPKDFHKLTRDITTFKLDGLLGVKIIQLYDLDMGWVYKVAEMTKGGVAADCGLRVGDTLVGVNGTLITGYSRAQLARAIASSAPQIILTICDVEKVKERIQRRKIALSSKENEETYNKYVPVESEREFIVEDEPEREEVRGREEEMESEGDTEVNSEVSNEEEPQEEEDEEMEEDLEAEADAALDAEIRRLAREAGGEESYLRRLEEHVELLEAEADNLSEPVSIVSPMSLSSDEDL